MKEASLYKNTCDAFDLNLEPGKKAQKALNRNNLAIERMAMGFVTEDLLTKAFKVHVVEHPGGLLCAMVHKLME